MTLDEARSALLAHERGDESYQESFGPRQWVLNHRGLNDADKAAEAARKASRELDKAVSKGVIHKNQAANRKGAVAKTAASVGK